MVPAVTVMWFQRAAEVQKLYSVWSLLRTFMALAANELLRLQTGTKLLYVPLLLLPETGFSSTNAAALHPLVSLHTHSFCSFLTSTLQPCAVVYEGYKPPSWETEQF